MRTKHPKFKIQTRKGRRMGEHGTRIQISDMNKVHKSETITVHNTTPQELKPKLIFFLGGVEYAEENECDITIIYKGSEKNGRIQYEEKEDGKEGPAGHNKG